MDSAIGRRREFKEVEFVPFSIEAGGVWGPAATRFFDLCLKLADSDRKTEGERRERNLPDFSAVLCLFLRRSSLTTMTARQLGAP